MLEWLLSHRDASRQLVWQPALRWQDAAAGPQASDGQAPETSVWVDSSRRFQTLLGFGGAFTEAAALTWQGLAPDMQAELLRACFDPHGGHGYRLCRLHMNSCDFSRGHWSHVPIAGDHALDSFSIAPDREALLPFLHAAQRTAGEPLQLLVSPWSPPAWMKTTGQMHQGGRLRPECRDAWARCFVRFIQAYAAEGLTIWGVTVQNEPAASQPWESCLFSAEEERDFIRDHLGPALEQAGLGGVRIVAWDHNRDAMVERASVLYADPAAARHIWGVGFHWYVEDHFEHVQQVHDAWPHKHLLFTEGCQEGGPHPGDWQVAERYARALLNDLLHWTEGWIDWNLLLDHGGGPNHVGNFCSAPVLASADGRGLAFQPSYAAIGQFARTLRPGAQRVLCASTRQTLETVAFRNPDGRIATVVLNRGDAPQQFRLQIDGRVAHAELPSHAIATYLA